MNKTCKRCGETKDISQFYKHKYMLDGHLNICISCKLLQTKAYREENLEKIKEYDRIRGRTEKRKNNAKEYARKFKANNPEGYNEMRRKAIEKSKEKHKKEYYARLQLFYAIRTGKIDRPKTCSLCGRITRLDAHHKDYNKPLDVVWLCKKCHGETHRK